MAQAFPEKHTMQIYRLCRFKKMYCDEANVLYKPEEISYEEAQ
jgi:hypothetical protein